MAKFSVYLSIIGSALACANGGGSTGPSSQNERTLVEFMNATHFDQVPLTSQELVDDSEVIVRGRIESVSDGRIVDFIEGPSNPLQMAVLAVDVSQTIKGPSADHAYFEYIRSDSPEAIGSRLPQEEVMLFLVRPRWDLATYKFEFPSRGLPDNATLLTLRSQQGFLLEADGVAQQVLAPNVPAFDEGSLDSIQAEVERLMGAVP